MIETNTVDFEIVTSTVSSLEHMEQVIIAGSDEHLDALLDVGKNIKEATESLNKLVTTLEGMFVNCPPSVVDKIILMAFPCLALSRKIIKNLCESSLYDGIQSTIEDFEDEASDLEEILNDLSMFKSSNAESPENYF